MRFALPLLSLGIWAGLAGVGCGNKDDDGTGGSAPGSTASSTSTVTGSGGSGGSGGSLALNWSPCDRDDTQPGSGGAECTSVDVPAKWDDPSLGTISLFLKRVLAEQQPSRGSIWFLPGGPGYSGEGYGNNIQAKTIDLYMIDHRGTGRSSRLGCPDAETLTSPGGENIVEEELPGCVATMKAEWGDKLAGFTITDAARDVGELINATRHPGDQVIIDSGSYGTDWANRYLELYPTQPTGVIMGAIAVGGQLSSFSEWFDTLGHQWLDLCGADAFCSSKMGPDPVATALTILDDFDAGACPAVHDMGLDRATLHTYWASFFYSFDQRTLIAPMLYRLGRCNADDIAFYQNFSDAITANHPLPLANKYFSLLLSIHISISELWRDPAPTVAEVEAFTHQAVVSHQLTHQFASVFDIWPRYPHDQYTDKMAETDVPILIMHGGLDFIPQAVIDPAVAHFSKPLQSFFVFDRAPHGLVTPTVDGGDSCASRVKLQMYLKPSDPIVPEPCEAAPLDFHSDPAWSQGIFGTTDAWEGTPTFLTIRTPEVVSLVQSVRQSMPPR